METQKQEIYWKFQLPYKIHFSNWHTCQPLEKKEQKSCKFLGSFLLIFSRWQGIPPPIHVWINANHIAKMEFISSHRVSSCSVAFCSASWSVIPRSYFSTSPMLPSDSFLRQEIKEDFTPSPYKLFRSSQLSSRIYIHYCKLTIPVFVLCGWLTGSMAQEQHVTLG